MNSFFRASDPAALVGRSPAPRLRRPARFDLACVYGLAAGYNRGLKAAASGIFLSENTVTENKIPTLPASAAHHRRSRRKSPPEARGRPGTRFMVGGRRSKADHVGLLAKILHITETNFNYLR